MYVISYSTHARAHTHKRKHKNQCFFHCKQSEESVLDVTVATVISLIPRMMYLCIYGPSNKSKLMLNPVKHSTLWIRFRTINFNAVLTSYVQSPPRPVQYKFLLVLCKLVESRLLQTEIRRVNYVFEFCDAEKTTILNTLEAINVLISNCVDHIQKHALYVLQLSWTVLVFLVAFFKHPIVLPQCQVFPTLCQIKHIYISLFVNSTRFVSLLLHPVVYWSIPDITRQRLRFITSRLLHESSLSYVLHKRKFDVLHFCFRDKQFPFNISKRM
jgi:hypothetical protein